MYKIFVQFLLVLSFIASSRFSHATADYEDPADILGMLRQFISQPKVADDVHALVSAGCLWSAERIWAGGNEEIGGSIYISGGQFTLIFTSNQSERMELQYTYQVKTSAQGTVVTSVRGGLDKGSSIEC